MSAASTAARGDGRSPRGRSGRWSQASGAAWAALRAALVPLLLSGALGAVAVRMILERAGEPALPLDDAFIHLQYARSLAEGRPFEYVPGEGYTTGATSWLWPALLAPFWKLGCRDISLVWAAWLLGGLAHAGTVLETARVASGLAGRVGGLLAGAMCAFFGAFAWFAWSGMETMLLAWVLMRTVRVGAELRESADPPAIRRAELALLGLLGPLVRPEGILCSLIAVLAAWSSRGEWLGPPRRWARRLGRLATLALPVAGVLLIPATHLALTGHAGSSTAQVKWLALDPTLDRATVFATVIAQLQFLLGDLLQGNAWTGIFLPDRFGILVLLGLGALTIAGLRPRWTSRAAARVPGLACGWRALFVWLVALGTLVPASYATMLWNRVRYIYPFAPAWFVAVACFGGLVGTQASRIRPALGAITPVLLGAVVGALASKLPWALGDLAQSARAIDRQQVELGRWATVLPADARIGVNDTGAIAYFSERRTFDVVGLTTEGQARYWMAGAGSRFEHYERLGAPRLPSHFIVYPEWLRCPPLLGTELRRATVLDQSILGGATMIAYQTRTDLLDTGANPFAPLVRGAMLDELDVADLESEQAHGYGPLPAPSSANVVGMWPTPDGRVVADGGRAERLEDRFSVGLRPGRRSVLVMRVSPHGPMAVAMAGATSLASTVAARGELWWGGYRPTDDPGGDRRRTAYEPWVEHVVTLPVAEGATVELTVRAADGGPFTAYHYWWFEPTSAEADEP